MSCSPPSKRSNAPVPRIEEATARQQLASLPVPDELLEEILVRIAPPIDLLRASTTCASFRRLITSPGFLRRYRSLHPPLILGTIKCEDDSSSSEVFQPTPAPHPSAPAGRAMARAADFSLDYVPGGRSGDWWYRSDAHDGRILVQAPCPAGDQLLPNLFVCDPLYRRYLLLPPIPDGQAYEQDLEFDDAFFVPRAEEDDDEASFRVAMEIHTTTASAIGAISCAIVLPVQSCNPRI
ncbi:hypothetical protein U9M48_015525 [Paspalum notatum var. saurae]|uniref:F-box domain-containing protein n=1 Tax=Paspalum notatum var. saurae TaxID=547442 RepID=A0AAQ3WLM5_PASNO